MPPGPTVIFPSISAGALASERTNLNSPGLLPSLPHRRSTFPPGEITVTRWLRSVTYTLPSGPMVRSVGWSSPSDFAVYLAVRVNGLGRADEAATWLVCPPAGAAAFALHPAPRSAAPARTTAAARRPFVPSMVPPKCRRSPWTVSRPCAQPHRGCPQGGTVASTEIMPCQRCHNRIMKDAAPRLATRASQAGPGPRAAAVRVAVLARFAAGLAGAAVAAGALAV